MMTFLRTCIAALLASCLVIGCGKQAVPQTHVVVYTALEPEEVDALVTQFSTEHPEIKLDIMREATGEITARLLNEGSNTKADVIWGVAATSLVNADAKGLLAPYAPAGLDQITPEFRDNRSVPHWVGIDGFMTAFAVNTVELAKTGTAIPQGYADLAKPAYHGMICMPKPTTSGTGFLTVAGILQIMGEDAGWKYLDQLDRNIAAYTESGSKPAENAGTGEHPIGISFDFRVLKEKAKGGPLQIIFPIEKSGWEMEANALIQKPNISPAAKTFLDWAIGATAFKYYSENYGVVANPAYMHPPAGFPDKPRDQMIKNNFAWAAENRDRILAEWTKRYGGKSAGK